MAVLTRKPGNETNKPSIAPRRANLKKPARTVSPSHVREKAKANQIETSPLNVEELIRSYGIELKRRPLADEVSGHLKVENGEWNITVNSLHHPNRQRFTLAHELAHFLLHAGYSEEFIDKKLFRDNSSNSMERQANSFAGALLMPEDDFRKFVRSVSSSIGNIAEHFGVSPMAVRMRARELGFKNHGLS